MKRMTSVFLTVLSLLLLVGGSIASPSIVDTKVLAPRILASNGANPIRLGMEKDEEARNLSVYALYTLDTITVRFDTMRTAELEAALASPDAQSGSSGSSHSLGRGWTLVSETGGLESSLSYPIRSVTQDFLYLGFQNLLDEWLLELRGGPDQPWNRMLLPELAAADRDRLRRRVQIVNDQGGDSDGEENYNVNRRRDPNETINTTGTTSGAEFVEEEETLLEETEPSTEGIPEVPEQQQQQSTETEQQQQTNAESSPPQTEEFPAGPAPTDNLPSTPQGEVPKTFPVESEAAGESPGTPQSESSVSSPLPPKPSENGPFSPEAIQPPASESESMAQNSSPAESQGQVPSTYLDDIYTGFEYNSIYDHLVTVDLRVKLYLRKDGYYNAEDSLRRDRRKLQMDGESGQVELLAEMVPTIAFLEPVTEAKKLNKPSNAEVQVLFGTWMEYLFGRQKDVYLRYLRQYPNQYLIQEITKLKVDVDTAPSSSASDSFRGPLTGIWSQRTQNALIALVVILGIVAVIWPMYAYARHVKKNRELSLQLMHGGLSLDGGGESSEFGDSFGSVTYRDNIQDMVKLPPIVPTVPDPNSAFPRPQTISFAQRTSSLDSMRHGLDVFPSRQTSDSQKSAISALEASDRYLARHRPDLYLEKPGTEAKGTVNVFGRVYEIPSNPFDFIYRGGQQQQQPPHPQQSPHVVSPEYAGQDLGRAAHFPFSSPKRTSLTGRPASVASNSYTGRSTSVGSTGSANHFTPIVVEPNQNLAAGGGDEEREERRNSVGPGAAAHTGHSWQPNNNESSFLSDIHPSLSAEGGGSVIGSIFRNLSISSWVQGNAINNSYTSNTHLSHDFNPTVSGGEEEVYYDNYHQQYPDGSMFHRDIELESLPNDEEDPANYDFAFQDFPRKDGTPCLIIDDDTFLSERKRRESAKMIFNIDDDNEAVEKDDGSISEKKVEDMPVSDEAFKQMLSQNALELDDSVLHVNSSGDDDSFVLPPLEGSFLNQDPHDAKSPEFQAKLGRLMETKRQRYTRENKNAAIVAANRKKRKNVRERERVDRHKAIEQELNDIEAEFSLTMQPLSPTRNNNANNSSRHSRSITLSPNTHSPKPTGGVARYSPKPTGGGARYSPMPSRMANSPVTKTIATLSPSRPNGGSSIAAHSPARSNMPRGRGGLHIRHNSLGGSHRKQSSLGASPFRKFSPRTRYPNHTQSHSMGVSDDIFQHEGSVSPPGGLADLNGPMPDYKPKFRPTNLYGADRFSGPQGVGGASRYDDLSLPAMTIDGDTDPQPYDAKFKSAPFKSPQAVIDEALQTGAGAMQKPNPFHQPVRHRHQRSLTPSRMRPVSAAVSSAQKGNTRRPRGSSFDVDDLYQQNIRQSGSSYSSASSSQLPQHPIIRQTPSGGGHRRAQSGGIGSNHRRSNSQSDDIFLHGVVAQTRFI